MSFAHVRTLLPAVVVLSACLPHAGNDESLAPVVHRGVRGSGSFAVTSAEGAQVAAFAVEDRVGGWVLHFLGATDGVGALTPASFQEPVTPSPFSTIVRTTIDHSSDACAIGLSGPPDANGRSFPSYDWGCSSFLGATQLSQRIIRFTQPSGNPHYFVLVATTSRIPSQRWSALADSLGTLSVLATAPGRLGRLAFGADSTARWVVKLAAGAP